MPHSDDPLTSSMMDEDLSALADGELNDPEAVRRVCARWQDDAQAQATWHAYQLVGDVLRSDDLASAPGHDSEFLARLRVHLAQQPVVLAPEPAAQRQPAGVQVAAVANGRSALLHWRMPAAMAAGFVAVAGAVVVFQMNSAAGPRHDGASGIPVVAAASTLPGTPASVALPPALPLLADAQAETVLDGRLIRDAHLDDYLAAHKKFGGSSAPGGPSGFLRNAAVEER